MPISNGSSHTAKVSTSEEGESALLDAAVTNVSSSLQQSLSSMTLLQVMSPGMINKLDFRSVDLWNVRHGFLDGRNGDDFSFLRAAEHISNVCIIWRTDRFFDDKEIPIAHDFFDSASGQRIV